MLRQAQQYWGKTEVALIAKFSKSFNAFDLLLAEKRVYTKIYKGISKEITWMNSLL
jgi:hypothetical protein